MSASRARLASGNRQIGNPDSLTSIEAYQVTLKGLQAGLSPTVIRLAGGGATQFTETDPWNMQFTVPQDGQGLANLYGGKAALAAKLDGRVSDPDGELAVALAAARGRTDRADG